MPRARFSALVRILLPTSLYNGMPPLRAPPKSFIIRDPKTASASPLTRELAANNLAMLLVTYRKDRASLERARELTSSFATSPIASLLDTYGWVRYRCADYGAALPALQRAAAQAPQSNIIRFHLGMTELGLGERARAREDLEAALAGSASFTGADEARTTLASLKLPRRSG